MQIEQFDRFSKSLGQFVFGDVFGRLTGPTTCVGDELTDKVVNGDGDPVGQTTGGAVADTESLDGFGREPALSEVGMIRLEWQGEAQGRIAEAPVVYAMAVGFMLGLSEGVMVAVGVARWLDGEPILDEEAGLPDADAFLAGNEIYCAAADMAVAEADPAVFAEADAELGGVMAVVEWTGTAQAVAVAAEFDAVVSQYLLHGDGLFEDVEADEFGFHGRGQKRRAKALPGLRVDFGSHTRDDRKG